MDNVVVVLRPSPCRSPLFLKGGGSDVSYVHVQGVETTWAHTTLNMICSVIMVTFWMTHSYIYVNKHCHG